MNKQIESKLKKGRHSATGSQEEQEMLALFHQPEIEFDVKSVLFAELDKFEEKPNTSPDYNKMFNRLWHKLKSTEPYKVNLYPLLRIAAVLIIGLILGILFNKLNTKTEPTVYYQANAPGGSISNVTLPDGSIIYLNAETDIKYTMNGKNNSREVFLEGEAWFNIQRNRNKPFIIHTRNYAINVTGTTFNVKAYKDEKEIITTLEEGEVKIVAVEASKTKDLVTLKPGEQAIFNKESKELDVREVNTRLYTSWKDNKLILVNHNFEDLVLLLERKFGVDIDIIDKDIYNLHFNGTFKDESLLEILNILKTTTAIDYRITDQRIELTRHTK